MSLDLVSRRDMNKPALLLEDGPVLTYAELHERIDDEAAAWAFGRACVFVVGDNDLPTLLAYLSALKAGAVPLLLGASMNAAQLAALTDLYQPRARWMASTGWQPTASPATDAPLHPDLALLLATSGTTGSPKLVRLSAANVLANASSIVAYLGIDAGERAITSLPFHYSYGLSVLHTHLLAGASVVLTRRSMMDAAFWQLMREQHVTSLAGVPYHHEMLLRLRLGGKPLPHLRTLTQAGGRLSPEKIRQVHALCEARGMRFFVMYGQTEATARMAYLPPADTLRKLGSIGVPIPGGRWHLEDDAGARLRSGADGGDPQAVGELVYEGPNVSMGYAQCRADLALPDVRHGVLHTGDLARLDEEGYAYLQGRRARFLKVFGIRVALDGVEQWAAQQGLEVAATGRDDQLQVHVMAPAGFDASAWRHALSQALGVHPSGVVVQVLADMPRLSTGKVDYACLKSIP